MSELQIREVGYGHADARLLIGQVQAEYLRIYGGVDASPVQDAEFSPPRGLFAVGYLDGQPVVMGGWRLHELSNQQTNWAAPAAELKRMYVEPDVRGAGFARQMLAFLEGTAGAAGARWLLLETGPKQPEAVALYRSAGYGDVPAFGYYACNGQSLYLGKELTVPGRATEDTGWDD